MKQVSKLMKLALVIMVLLMWGCRDNDEGDVKTQALGKTRLFGQVTNPEPSQQGGYSEKVYMSDTGLGGSGTIHGSGNWGDGNPNGQFDPGVLTAGEWNDLENWDFWKNLLNNQEYYEDVNRWNLKEINRYSFLVTDNTESPVANAEISLLSGDLEVWKTRTDNKGEATLWSDKDLDGLTARIKYEDDDEMINAIEFSRGINKVSLNKAVINNKVIDIYFAVDATGSMQDEIDYLKAELNDVIKRIKQNNPSLNMRFGSVFYRDEGDDFVTRPFNFTSDETSLLAFIAGQDAAGGGDFPEAVHSALDVAITQNSWNENASSRILFLLLDAPPHYTQEVISSLELNLIKAAEKGIKIIPVTASGIDKATEYLMRSFALLTNGTYVFITDHSGIGNSHLIPTIGDYEVEKLNDLLVRLVGEYVP